MLISILKLLFDRGNKTKRGRKQEVALGDVVCVDLGDSFFKRYGIYTGENFILFGEDSRGKNTVHVESFRDFLQGAEHFAICQLPEQYGRPTEWEQPSPFVSSIVAPEHRLRWMLKKAEKATNYRLYPPEETVSRARSKLGDTGYKSSEHFALWCKTGIAESHEQQSIWESLDRMVVY